MSQAQAEGERKAPAGHHGGLRCDKSEIFEAGCCYNGWGGAAPPSRVTEGQLAMGWWCVRNDWEHVVQYTSWQALPSGGGPKRRDMHRYAAFRLIGLVSGSAGTPCDPVNASSVPWHLMQRNVVGRGSSRRRLIPAVCPGGGRLEHGRLLLGVASHPGRRGSRQRVFDGLEQLFRVERLPDHRHMPGHPCLRVELHVRMAGHVQRPLPWVALKRPAD